MGSVARDVGAVARELAAHGGSRVRAVAAAALRRRGARRARDAVPRQPRVVRHPGSDTKKGKSRERERESESERARARAREREQDSGTVQNLFKTAHARRWDRCPYCQKIWLWLEEKQVPYRVEKVTMFCYGEKETWYKRVVPSGMLPALKLDSRVAASFHGISIENSVGVFLEWSRLSVRGSSVRWSVSWRAFRRPCSSALELSIVPIGCSKRSQE